MGINAKVGVPLIEGPEGYSRQADELWQQWTHTLEELAIRHGPWPAGMKPGGPLQSEPFPDYVGERAEKAARAVKRITECKGKTGEVFVKLGRIEHMESLFRCGQLRVQPASFYGRPDHTGAIRDDELSLLLSLSLPRDMVVKFVQNPQDIPLQLPDHRLNIQLKSRGDYWMYCLAKTLKPRLFVDFEAEACVIIHDRKRFSSLLREASAAHFPDAGSATSQSATSTRCGPRILGLTWKSPSISPTPTRMNSASSGARLGHKLH